MKSSMTLFVSYKRNAPIAFGAVMRKFLPIAIWIAFKKQIINT